MKKLCLVFGGLLILSSMPAHAVEATGFLFQNTVQPLMGSSATQGAKVGKASCYNILGYISWGDCSLKKATQKGNVRSVGYADQSVLTVLGISKIETRVYGK